MFSSTSTESSIKSGNTFSSIKHGNFGNFTRFCIDANTNTAQNQTVSEPTTDELGWRSGPSMRLFAETPVIPVPWLDTVQW